MWAVTGARTADQRSARRFRPHGASRPPWNNYCNRDIRVLARHQMSAYSDIRVLVTGDQALIRTAIARLLAFECGIEVIGECGHEHGALTKAMELRPDLVLMDLDGSESVIELLGVVRHRPVLVLIGDERSRVAPTALGHGATGVVFKSRPVETLMRAIRVVVAGEAWVEPSMLPSMLNPEPRHSKSDGSKLTPREQEIVDLLSLGLTNKTIAGRLFITETTVRHHLTSIFNKLEVKNRLELMRYAYGGGTFVPVGTPRKVSLPPMRGDE